MMAVKYKLSVNLGTLIYRHLLTENREHQYCSPITQSFITSLKLTY